MQTSTEQPIRKKLKKQSIATELPKRRKHWRCGGLALAFSIIVNDDYKIVSAGGPIDLAI